MSYEHRFEVHLPQWQGDSLIEHGASPLEAWQAAMSRAGDNMQDRKDDLEIHECIYLELGSWHVSAWRKVEKPEMSDLKPEPRRSTSHDEPEV